MKAIKKIEFEAHLVREYSIVPNVDDLGFQKQTMELFTETSDLSEGVGQIEWIVGVGTEDEDLAAYIGVYWDETNELIDYDGVFSLPIEAVQLLRKCGIKVSKDFEFED